MLSITSPVTQSAFAILVSVLMGTGLLIAVAIIRRWQQIRYARYVHALQREYRPSLAKFLSGAASPAGMAAMRELPLDSLEILLDPLFSRRKITERQMAFLQAICAELGLIALWQGRLANGHNGTNPVSPAQGPHACSSDPAVMRHLLRAKSIRNLGALRYQPSWTLLVRALDDRHPDIQLVALRSLAALHVPESFPVLLERLHATVQGASTFPPAQGLQAALVRYDLACVPALAPSLCHANWQIRLIATDILQTIISARAPGCASTPETLSPRIVELLLTELCADTSAEVRGRAAQAIVYLADSRAIGVLRNLLLDPQWIVRLRTVRALANLRQAAPPLYPDLRQCLRDSHWRVREAAAQTLLSLGQEGKCQLYEHFLASQDSTTREQILEVIGRTGLLPALVEEYGDGAQGLVALMVERLASDSATLGFAGVLRTLNPEVRQKFWGRYFPHAQFLLEHGGKTPAEVEKAGRLQQVWHSRQAWRHEGNWQP